ncbi:MAG TPA: sigma-70 family RNA polymerase sigma factor, partial [Gemmata sp.]|nr:sigma-70 family RNA polymerase sigma factor [Gemmata sp.]
MATKVGDGVLRAALSSAVATQLTDCDLLARFAKGDESAFETIVNRHTSMVLGVCRRMLPTLQDAEDACQATFLVLARKAKTSNWQSSIANWLYTTARRVASKASRAAACRLKRESGAMPSSPISVLDQMTGREVFTALDEELDNLPAIHREPLVLCYLQGLTRDEAALRLGVPAATLKSQLERGRKKLADALTKRGIDIGAGLMAVAATSTVGASSPRMIQSILATIGGSPSVSVAALANGVAMKGFALRTKMLALATVATAMMGFGLASLPIAAGPQERATNEDAKNTKPRAEQPVLKAKEPPKYQPIDPETIAAYENLRAVYGAIDVTDSGPIWFLPGNEAAMKGVPGFNLVSLPDGMLGKLPPVQVPFGLDLYNLQLTDANLKELKEINNLTALILDGYRGTQLTDVSLKELKDLKNLTMLRICFEGVTDAGLKELKEL